MLKFIRRSSWAKGSAPHHSTSGAAALFTVLAVMAVMLVLAGTAGLRARQELRMSIAETDAAKMQQLVLGRFNKLANDAWGAAYPPVDECSPYPASFPVVCATVLAQRPGDGTYQSFPVRVTYQRTAASEKREFYGWVLRWPNAVDPNVMDDVKVYTYYFWCPPPPPDPDNQYDTGFGPCKIG